MASLETLYSELNIFLANQLVLSMKIHNVHWYIKGSNFFTLHEKMDEYYDDTQKYIDEVAERLLMIGAAPIGGLQAALDIATIKEREAKKVTAVEMVELLALDFATVNKHANRLVAMADELSDYATADYFTSVIAYYEKQLWMLHSYLD